MFSPLVATCDGVDTVGVWGSNPHAPTNAFKNLAHVHLSSSSATPIQEPDLEITYFAFVSFWIISQPAPQPQRYHFSAKGPMKAPDPQSYRDYPVCGRVLRRQEIAGSVLSETEYPPHLSIPRHVHDQVGYFCLTLQGGYTEYSKHQNRELGPATLLYHASGEAHSDKFIGEQTRLFCVWVSRERLRSLRVYAQAPDKSAHFSCGSTLQLALRMYKEFRSMDELSPLVIEGLTLELLAETFRDALRDSEPIDPPWISGIRDLLHVTFNESLLISEIAKLAGVHPVHLSRVFCRHFGCTVGEYVCRLRVDFACRELSHSRKPLTEIAATAGFCDQGHLSRTVKRFTGMTPAEYRSAFRLS